MAETPCPVCKRAATIDRVANPSAPFCSSRCKTIDLGRWLGEGYRIPVDDVSGEGDGSDESTQGTPRVPPRGEG